MIQALTTRIGIGLLLAAVLVGFGWWQGGASARQALDQEQRDHKATKGFYAQVLKQQEARAREVARLARVASDTVKRERRENDARAQEQEHESNREIAELRRRLRAGELSLQPWWSCPAAGPDPGDAAALASGQDAGADLRIEGALATVGDADHADRWIGWLQSELVTTREAMKAARCAVEVD